MSTSNVGLKAVDVIPIACELDASGSTEQKSDGI